MEHLLAKEGVAGSIPVSRFFFYKKPHYRVSVFTSLQSELAGSAALRHFLLYRKLRRQVYAFMGLFLISQMIPSVYGKKADLVPCRNWR